MINTKALILLVDDNEDDRMLMLRSLKKSDPGAEVVSIASGSEALKYLDDLDDSPNPTVLLLDLNMPVMSGDEFLDEVSQDASLGGMTIIVVSTEINAARLARVAQSGAKGRLRKPFEPEELRAIIERTMEASQ